MKKNITYSCEIWSSSTDLKTLKLWMLLLPVWGSHTGLSTKIKRFTLVCSPLGNKRAKDQFERREYRSYFFLESKDSFKVLAFISLLKYSNNLKSKIVFRIHEKTYRIKK